MNIIIKDWNGKNYYYGNSNDIVNQFRNKGYDQDELIYRIIEEENLEEENFNSDEMIEYLKDYLPRISSNFYLEIEDEEDE